MNANYMDAIPAFPLTERYKLVLDTAGRPSRHAEGLRKSKTVRLEQDGGREGGREGRERESFLCLCGRRDKTRPEEPSTAAPLRPLRNGGPPSVAPEPSHSSSSQVWEDALGECSFTKWMSMYIVKIEPMCPCT